MNASAAASAAAAAELHLKMCKKVAQLTKVIFQLNTRNEDYQAEAEHTRTTHAAEIQKLTQDAVDKMRALQNKLQTQAATAAQRERQHVADRQKLMSEAQQQQRRTQASRAAAEEAFQAKVTELEAQVQDAQRAFDERVEQLTQLAAAKEKERAVSAQQASMDFDAKMDELREQHTDEVEQLVTTSNAKYNKMLAEQLRAQDVLKADLVSAKLDWEKQRQDAAAEHERKRLEQDVAAKTAFDKMKHELVTKIEALLVDVEALRGSETKLREEKEAMVKTQQEAARAIKQLELQLSKAQQDSQSVRRDASAHAEELQRMLAVSTDKIDELAQELVTLKQTLQTRDRALVQAQKDLEAAQMETLKQNASASELEAQLRQQLNEHELQLANGKSEALLASQRLEAGQKQIHTLEQELAGALKSIADMQTEGASNTLTQAKLKQELARAEAETKQAKIDSERALTLLRQTHESKLQELMSSHTHEMETQRVAAAKQLEQLELRMKEASARSTDERIAELKSEHQRVLAEHEAASSSAQTKLRDEIAKLETQVNALNDQLAAQLQQLTELQKKNADLTRQLESSQQQVASLQSAKDALHSSTLKSRKERDEAHQSRIRELESQHGTAIKALTAEKTQQEQQHAKAILQLAQEHADALRTSTERLEARRLEDLTDQEKRMRELYEPQLAKLRGDLESLQRALGASTEQASEARRSMEETRLFEQEQLRSAIVGFVERTAAERARVEQISRQELEKLRQDHANRERELEKRFLDESTAQLSSLQAKADADFARLMSDHRQELQTSTQQHAEALQKLQESLNSAQERSILAERADAAKQLAELSSKKDRERSEALREAQAAHDQQYGELRVELDSTKEALAKKTLEWASAMRDGQNVSAALAAKTEEMAQKLAALEKSSREQVETLKLAAKREMDKLLEENLAETRQLSDQFEETRRVMAEKVAYLKTTIAEWQDRYARRESRPEDVARIVELERYVVEKDALVRRTLDEMAYFKRELLNREEMYNKTFARTPNVGMLQVLKPHVQLQQQMQMQPSMVLNPMHATPPPRSRGKPKTMEQPGELTRRRSERGGFSASPPSTASSSSNQKALPPLHNNQGFDRKRSLIGGKSVPYPHKAKNIIKQSKMATVDAELQRIAHIADQKEKTAAYKSLLEEKLQDLASLKAIVTHLLGEDVLLVISRAAITHLASVVAGIDVDAHPWKLEFICFCLAKIKPRILSFEEPDVMFRESLAAMYMDEEEYIEAAKALAAINLESSTRQYSDVEKAEKYVKIAELYLQEDETVDAENFINRASRFIHNVEDWALKLRFQVSYARILDSKRKFLDAALRYYEFSQSKPDEVDPDDLLELLSKAVTCAILASAGPQRSRLLGTLYKDERVKNSEHVAILEKMYMEQLIRRPELVQFEKSLLPHQKAVLSNGFTVLENAFLEHNLLAASRVYSSISLEELGKLLEIEPANAERVAATMIGEERMKGSIDQHLGFLEFENTEDEVLAAFDTRISSVCFNVNQCAEQIEQQYPDIVRSLTEAAATATAP